MYHGVNPDAAPAGHAHVGLDLFDAVDPQASCAIIPARPPCLIETLHPHLDVIDIKVAADAAHAAGAIWLSIPPVPCR
jgi:hypothetical protein